MVRNIEAVYERGVFRPREPLPDLPEGASVRLTIDTPTAQAKPSYNFTDLAGRLQWSGDALAQQRKLRDEW